MAFYPTCYLFGSASGLTINATGQTLSFGQDPDGKVRRVTVENFGANPVFIMANAEISTLTNLELVRVGLTGAFYTRVYAQINNPTSVATGQTVTEGIQSGIIRAFIIKPNTGYNVIMWVDFTTNIPTQGAIISATGWAGTIARVSAITDGAVRNPSKFLQVDAVTLRDVGIRVPITTGVVTIDCDVEESGKNGIERLALVCAAAQTTTVRVSFPEIR